jgi:hypothetical protein
VEPGWAKFSVNPVASPLEWVKGSVVTPKGLIHAELEQKGGALKGVVRYPRGLEAVKVSGAGEGLEFEAVGY